MGEGIKSIIAKQKPKKGRNKDKDRENKERQGKSFDFSTFNFWIKEALGEDTIIDANDGYLAMKDLAKADQESFWIIGLNDR